MILFKAFLPRLPLFQAFHTVRGRMLFWILAVVVPIYAFSVWSSYDSVAKRLQADAVRDADELAERLVAGLDAVVAPIEGAIHTLAFQLEQTDPPRARYAGQIRGLLSAWPDLYGSTIALEANGVQDQPFAPYLYRRDGAIASADLAAASYAYRKQPWYRNAADSGKAIWSAPYFDRGGGETWMVTYSVPFYRRAPDGSRALAGVMTADLDMNGVRGKAADVALGPVGMAWLSAAAGAEEFAVPIGDSDARLARLHGSLQVQAARREATAMLARGQGFGLLPGNISTNPTYVAARSLGTLGWKLTLLIPRHELLAQARQQLRRQLMLGGIGTVALLFAVSLVAAGIARPIHELAAAVGTVDPSGEATLRFHLPASPRQDEVGVLTEALRRLRDSLQQHVQLRAASLAAESRLQQELDVSAQIQQSMLPHGAAILQLPPSLEIAARLIPARRVGGDLYDFFALPDGQLLFAVADVSDKGIPAALFMARLSALLRVLGMAGGSPDHLLAEINNRLSEGNDACMFATAGIGVLSPQTGAFTYASAGHDAPLLRLLEGEVHLLHGESGAAMGIDAGAQYPLQHGRLAPGDTLLLFTDGLTEAASAGGTLFGTGRIAAVLREAQASQPFELVAKLVDDVDGDATDFLATDDLTIMALRYVPPGVVTRVAADGAGWLIVVEPTAAGLKRAQLHLRGILAARGIAGELCHDVELVAEEWLSNVLKAECNARLQRVEMDLLLAPATIRLAFRDDGAAFNPLDAADPDLEVTLGDRPIGGLGLHLVRQTAQICNYTRSDGCNLLTVQFARN